MAAKNSKPNRGDLIEFQRGSSIGPFEVDLYCHWALYVGDGEVVHLARNANNLTTYTVKKEKLDKVAKGSEWKVNNKQDKEHPPRSQDEIVSEANEWVGMTVPYNLLFNNCEHFVTSLRNNVPVSEQARNAILALGVMTVTAAMIGVGVGRHIHEKKKRDERVRERVYAGPNYYNA